MKTLVFNDTHLSDRFDSELFDYIAKLVKSADQVIINGDFWDSYLTTFDSFINSKWNQLFPLLKEKKTIYIFGNHDKKEHMDKRYYLFSDIQTLVHTMQSGKSKFVFQHGHLLSPTYDARFLFKNNTVVRPFYKLFMGFLSQVALARKIHRKTEFAHGYRKLQRFIQGVSKNITPHTYYIFGHAHIHTIAPTQKQVVVVGVLQKGRKHHMIIEEGKLHLVPEKQLYDW